METPFREPYVFSVRLKASSIRKPEDRTSMRCGTWSRSQPQTGLGNDRHSPGDVKPFRKIKGQAGKQGGQQETFSSWEVCCGSSRSNPGPTGVKVTYLTTPSRR